MRLAFSHLALCLSVGVLAAACGPQTTPAPDVAIASISEPLTGQAGALSVTTANTVVNQYGVLAANAAAGATTITITSAADFPAAGAFTTALAAGDLLMLYQPQGATISGASSAVFGTVTALGGAGNYELVHVASVAGTTIGLETSCGGLKHAYTTAGATEVIRIPQATTLTISGAGSLTASAWDGARGGVLAVQAQTTMTIGGAGIDASGEGFRGGAVDNVTTGPPGTTTIRSNNDATGAEKGESIAGYEALYDSADNGRYGRGAPANGGGGGDAHNAGGGGGANGDNGSAYTGAGVMSAGVTGAGAWAIDPDAIANGGPTTSSGGGRGGYSFADAAEDPLTVGPGNTAWTGDDRRDVGGLGGRPLANDPTARLFLGGGGGAGDGNNNVAGPGGAGGGLILLIADSVTGTAAITSDGGNGGNSAGNPGDAPGGAGAGGTIVVAANALAGVALHADGGAGGNQTQAAANEAEGPGGGGGGGYIAVTGGTPAQTAAGALGGTTNSSTMTAFPSDGATSGATGVTSASAAGLPVCAPDDLQITLTDGVAAIAPGAPDTYTIVVTNAGADVIAGATVTDAFPAALTGVTWTCVASAGSTCPASGTGDLASTAVKLAPGGTVTVTVKGTVDPAATGTLVDTATVAAPAGITDATPGNNTATDTDALTASADLSVTINDTPDPVPAGGSETYTVTVTSSGPSPAQTVTVTDTLPAGVTFVSASGPGWACSANGAGTIVTCTIATLPPGSSVISIVVTAPATPGSITNTATASSTTPDPAPGNNTGTATTTVSPPPGADLGVTVTGAPDPVAAGGTLVYTVAVTNAGPSAASTVSVVDTLPAGVTFVSATGTGWACTHAGQVVTCTRPTAATGAQPTIAIAVTAPATAGSITDSVTVSAATPDPTTTNNSATDTTSVNASADLAISVADAPDPVTTGAALVYTITVTNTGPSTATGLSVTDTLPAGVTFVNASGAGWTCAQGGSIVVCTIATAGPGVLPPISIMLGAPVTPGAIIDAATVTSATADPNPANNTAMQTTTVTGSADLAVALAASPDPVVASGTLTYGVTVTNGGTSLAAGVTVVDTLPAGVAFTSAAGTGWTCSDAGQVVTCTAATLFVGTAPAIGIVAIAPGAGGTITDAVSVGATTPDPNLANNTATIDTDVTASADLGVAVGAAPDPVPAGGTLTYTITPVDNGPSAAGAITITDTLPAGATFVSATGTGWTCTVAGQVVTCTTPAGGPGAISPITIVVAAPAGGGAITDTATISSTTADPTPGNNTDSITTNVTPPPTSADLAISLAAAPSPVAQGGALTYTIGVDNLGPDPSQLVTVTDTLAAGLTFVSATGGGWTCTASGTVVTCTVAMLAAGPAPAIAIVVTATVAPGSVDNTATVASSVTPDPAVANNSATLGTLVDPAADVAITVAGAPDPVDANTAITYTIGVRNNGPADAAGVVVTDALPAGAAFGSASGAGWTCSGGTATVTCTLAASLTSGTSAGAITITAAAPGGGGPITDTATVTATTDDPDLGNNTATITTNDDADADLAIAIDGDPAPVIIGGTITYSIRVTDNGPSDATGVKVTNTLPDGITIVTQPFGDEWSCFNEVCTRPTLAAGTSAMIQLAVSAPLQPTTLTDSVTVSGTATDPDLSNNSASVDVDVGDGGLGVRGGGCDSTGGGSGNAGGLVLALGALGLALGRRRHAAIAGAALATLVLAAAPARAQVMGAPETFSVERMRLSIDGDGLLDVEWASVHPQWKWNVATWVGLENDPLVVYSMANNQRTESLVHNRFDGSLLGAVGLTSWLELGLQVPLIYDQSNEGTAMLPSPASPKLGDLTIAPKVLLVRGGADATSVGMMFELTTPTGGSTGYTGPDNVSFIPELIVSRPIGDLRLSGNLGYVAQPETQVLNLRIDDELFLRAGAGYRLGHADLGERKPLELDVTYSMATAAAHPFAHVNSDAYELDGALGYDVTREVTLYGLSGAGIGAGFGSPDWRVVLGARYSRREAKQRLDRDGDGIYDDEDKCPDEPEDKDGFQDEDGCPDLDNDHDGIPDAKDKCPNDPEDKDGFQDDDGCPDPDNDQDGIPDVKDKCPNEPEDKDGFQDEDGCPDPDNDGDGVLDVDDKCPLQPGPKENGGCPDPDRDGDGVVDRLDNCPDVPGKPENAGCPDKQLVKINGDKLEIMESVYFKLDKAVIEKRSYKLLDNVAAVINAHPALVIQVEGHTDSQGKPAYNQDLSQRRAQAVADYLAGKSVDPAHLKPVGFGQDRPIADNKTATGRAQNRRVVFTILSGADGATIQNKQQGADDSTKEIEMDGK